MDVPGSRIKDFEDGFFKSRPLREERTGELFLRADFKAFLSGDGGEAFFTEVKGFGFRTDVTADLRTDFFAAKPGVFFFLGRAAARLGVRFFDEDLRRFLRFPAEGPKKNFFNFSNKPTRLMLRKD